MTDNQITVHKLFSLKAIRVSSFFFGIFVVTLMVVSNLKVLEKLTPEKSLSPFLKKKYPKSYSREIFKELWLYTIITSLIMFFFYVFITQSSKLYICWSCSSFWRVCIQKVFKEESGNIFQRNEKT